MPEATWVTILASLVSGGALVKAADYLFDEYKRRRDRTATATALLTKHLDPILTAADELVGQVRSLAISDFADFRQTNQEVRAPEVLDLRRISSVFYFVQLWARLQLLKSESDSIALAANVVGERLQRFIQQLETHAVRIVDRTWQRATGEAIILVDEFGQHPMNLYQFSNRYHSEGEFRVWFAPLAKLLEQSGSDSKARQRLLKYGVVVHALIDTLDPNHIVTIDRDPWPNKLAESTRKELALGTFRTHLPFVGGFGRYTQPKKKAARRGAEVHR